MKKIVLLAVGLALVFALTACGGGAVENVDSADQEVTIIATDFDFNQAEYRVQKGEAVTLTLVNEQGHHGIEVRGLGISLSPGQLSKSVVINKAGTYEIICNIPCGTGHNSMKAKLIVEG